MKRIVFIYLILSTLLIGGCKSSDTFDDRLNDIVKPYHFGIARWELGTIPNELRQLIFDRPEKVNDEAGNVKEYFDMTKQIKSLRLKISTAYEDDDITKATSLEKELSELEERKADLNETVESIIERQIREIFNEQGIFNPVLNVSFNFPPINFSLEKPPYVMVISPRDKIESIREITLQPDLTPDEIEDIERRADELGVSSLVVTLGGLGATYPTFVTNESSLQFTISTAAEEWLHQYMVMKPLGFLYLLDITGISRNYDIATMNETLVGIVSKEIGAIVYEKYYSVYYTNNNQSQMDESDFDFNLEMRQIRIQVDDYLSQGKIEQAEEYMEERRLYLASNGYYIRKLNQAYFAFHGTYADKPTSVNPIGLELRELRSQSTSLKDFLDTVAGMTSRQDLTESIN
jgi:hypothetical protein